jgi:hypothetical protein
VPKTHAEDELYVEICFRDLKMDGAWAKPKSRYLRRDVLCQLPDTNDRRILAFLAGAKPDHGANGYGYDYGAGGYLDALPFRYRSSAPQAGWILTTLCQSGRCRLRLEEGDEEPQWVTVNWQESEPWHFRLSVRRQDDGHYALAGELSGDGQRKDPTSVLLAYGGICFTRESAVPCEPPSALRWITFLRQQGPPRVPAAQRDEFLAELLSQPDLPPLDVPEELRYEEVFAAPRPRLTVKPNRWRPGQLQGELSFGYGGAIVAYEERSRAVVQGAQRRILLRDLAAERAAHERLQRLGWRQPSVSYPGPETRLELTPQHLPNVVRGLTAEGWHVEAEGKVYRSPGGFNIQATSGIDWFELHGGVEFGNTTAPLPTLLAALRRGESIVKLGFAQARDELWRFTGVEPVDPPVGFHGELRSYQQEGLGCSIPGGIRRWRRKRSTAPTASGRPTRFLPTGSSPGARWRRRCWSCRIASESWRMQSSAPPTA